MFIRSSVGCSIDPQLRYVFDQVILIVIITCVAIFRATVADLSRATVPVNHRLLLPKKFIVTIIRLQFLLFRDQPEIASLRLVTGDTFIVTQPEQHGQSHLQRRRRQEVLLATDHEGSHSQVLAGRRRLAHLMRFNPPRRRDHPRLPCRRFANRKIASLTQCLIRQRQWHRASRLGITIPLGAQYARRGTMHIGMQIGITLPQVLLVQLLILLRILAGNHQIIFSRNEPMELFEPHRLSLHACCRTALLLNFHQLTFDILLCHRKNFRRRIDRLLVFIFLDAIIFVHQRGITECGFFE
mmetsp:Transcript_17588/g.49734  ORF Transcript_17588/g.49734 Transcript_17588/m.49734 type:complete len:298 (-) Transcript_17588:1672-2565(-)